MFKQTVSYRNKHPRKVRKTRTKTNGQTMKIEIRDMVIENLYEK